MYYYNIGPIGDYRSGVPYTPIVKINIYSFTNPYYDKTYRRTIKLTSISMETICGIIAACLPTIRPVLKDAFSKTTSLWSYFSSKSRLQSFSNPGYPLPESTPNELHDFHSSGNLRHTTNIHLSTSNDSEHVRLQEAANGMGIVKTTKIGLTSQNRDKDFKPNTISPYETGTPWR
jgi:hypothetical protein